MAPPFSLTEALRTLLANGTDEVRLAALASAVRRMLELAGDLQEIARMKIGLSRLPGC